MTDTDDTDDLLLIPPDFFAIESDSGQSNTDPYYSIVDSLIEQVGNLQNRIKSIESSESFLSNSPNSYSKKTRMQKHKNEHQKYNSFDDIYVPFSTPQKPYTKFKLNSLPSSPYVDKFNTSKYLLECKSLSPSPNRNKQTSSSVSKENKTLNEVDSFLSNVKTIKRLGAIRNLENEFNFNGENTSNVHRNVTSDSISKINQTNQAIKKQSEIVETAVSKDKCWQLGDNKESVPDYGVGIREQFYGNLPEEHTVQNENPYNDLRDNENYISSNFPNLTSDANHTLLTDQHPDSESSLSESISQVTTLRYSKPELLKDPIHTNALNILYMHKQLTENSSKKLKNQHREQKFKKSNQSGTTEDLGLLSLADIWSTADSQLLQLKPQQLYQKLQEEKLRRQHCENLIQDLQNRNLELQQKLTVAVKVDESKNITIVQFQGALQKLMSKMQLFQKEKSGWENEKSHLKANHSDELKDSIEKIQYYEKELSKALNIAHSNSEKMAFLEKKCSDLQIENNSLKINQKDMEDLLFLERKRNNELSETLNSKESEIVMIKEELNTAKSEIVKTNEAITSYQDDFFKLKEESNRLQVDLKNNNAQILRYEGERKQLIQEVEETKKRESKLKEEINAMKKQLDQNKLELRNFYQGQMEVLVQNKLKEFQSQLDKAESNFKEREMAVAKTAAMHIQQMSEKYSIEIKLLEKKHQEETKLYQVQIMQYKQQNEDLQTKLNHIQEKRITIAKQLKKIMETQWSEALRIIASGKSPTFNNEESFSTIDQLNSLKTRSYNNLEEILTKHVNEHFNPDKDVKETLPNEEQRNGKDNLILSMETPVSSRIQGNKHYNEYELQKYINLFLNRPTHEGTSREPDSGLTYEHIDWLNERGDGNRTNKTSQKDKKLHKRPWK